MTSYRSNIVRFVTQWVLPLVAVVVLFQIVRGSALEFRALRKMFVFDPVPDDSSTVCWKMFGLDNLPPDQKLILEGDRTQSSTIEREKAIWEKWPTNIVYLHNYISHYVSLAPYCDEEVKTNKGWRTNFAQDIVKLQALEPDNARFDYILAGNLLAEASKYEPSMKDAAGKVTEKGGLKVLDRAKLDKAMAHFKVGLGKTRCRRYASEMAAERLAIMGEPTTLLKEIAEIGVIAGMPLPDLSLCRELGRTSMAYVGILIDEGRTNDARECLSACRKFVPQINNDAYTLIDVLVVGAVAGIVAEKMPAAYIRLGDAATAQQVGIETTALAFPVKDWKQRKNELPNDSTREKLISRHSGSLVGLLLPALGEYPTAADLTPGRLLDYVVGERGALGALSVFLVIMMVFCVILASYYHLASKAALRTVYILPCGGDWVRLLLLGGLLPLMCYYGVTRCVPWGNRSLSLEIEYPQAIIQFIALSLVIVSVMSNFTIQLVRRGCDNLGVTVFPVVPVFWRVWGWILVGLPVMLAVLPESWLTDEDLPGHAWAEFLPAIIGGVLILSGLAYLGYGIVRRQWFRKVHAAYYGSLARALIPVIAVTVIVLNILAQPYLRREERCLISSDTLMHIDPKGGFTAIESRLVQRLKAEMQQAAARFPEVHISPKN